MQEMPHNGVNLSHECLQIAAWQQVVHIYTKLTADWSHTWVEGSQEAGWQVGVSLELAADCRHNQV